MITKTIIFYRNRNFKTSNCSWRELEKNLHQITRVYYNLYFHRTTLTDIFSERHWSFATPAMSHTRISDDRTVSPSCYVTVKSSELLGGISKHCDELSVIILIIIYYNLGYGSGTTIIEKT